MYCWLGGYDVFLCDLKKSETHCPVLWLLRGFSTPVILNPPAPVGDDLLFWGWRHGATFPFPTKSPFFLSVVSVPAGQCVADGEKANIHTDLAQD